MPPRAAGCKRWLGLNPHRLPWLDAPDGRQGRRNERKQVFKRVAGRAQHNNAHTSFREVLLKFEILVAGHEDQKPSRLSLRQQRAVLETCPPLLLDGANVVTD